MKKITIILCVLLIGCFSSCAKQSSKEIIGYWTSADNNDSISFDNLNAVVINEKYIGRYSIIDNNKIAINVDTALLDDVYDVSMSALFNIKEGILQITDTENYQTYIFYNEDQQKKLKNEEYQLIYRGTSPVEYMAYPISYADEWELHLDGTSLEGKVTQDTLTENASEALKIAKREILPLYQNSRIDGKKLFTCSCTNASLVWYAICYEILIECEDNSSQNFCYLIDPSSKMIYIYDEEGFVSIWSGMIQGNSILEYI